MKPGRRFPQPSFSSHSTHLSAWKKGLSLLHQRNQHDLLMIDATLVFIKSTYTNIHPGRLTWNLQITHLEGKMIFQASMIMFHVNLQGCTPNSERFYGGKNDFQLSRSPCPEATKISNVFDHLKSFGAGEMVAEMSNYFVLYFHIYIYIYILYVYML